MAGPWCSLHRLKRDTAHLWWAQALPPCSAQAVPSARAVSGLLRNGCSAIHCSSKPPQRNNYLPHHLAPSLSPRPGTLRRYSALLWGKAQGVPRMVLRAVRWHRHLLLRKATVPHPFCWLRALSTHTHFCCVGAFAAAPRCMSLPSHPCCTPSCSSWGQCGL